MYTGVEEEEAVDASWEVPWACLNPGTFFRPEGTFHDA